MRIYTRKILSTVLTLAALVASVFIFTGVGQADDHHKLKGWIERSERNRSSIFDRHDEGNETAGQIAAWLLVAANLPVVLSVLIKWTNRFIPINATLKNGLSGFIKIGILRRWRRAG